MHRTQPTALKRLGPSRAVLLPLAAQERCRRPEWFINDAITHNVPFFAACCKRNADILEAQAIRLLSILQAENWADLEQFWRNLKCGDRVDVLEALTEKINEIEKEGK